MTTTKDTPEEAPLPKLPRPFDDARIDGLLLQLRSCDAAEGRAILRDVYAFALEHGAAICSLTRAQKMADATALLDAEEKRRAKAAGFAVERAADSMLRVAAYVRGGGDVASEIDDLRKAVTRKEEPDPGSVLGWLKVERARPGTSTATPLSSSSPEPDVVTSCVGAVLVRGLRVALPARSQRDPGVPVVVKASGYLRRFSSDARPGRLDVVLEVHCAEDEPIEISRHPDPDRVGIGGDDVDRLVGGVAAVKA